jgi:hypothetical protein
MNLIVGLGTLLLGGWVLNTPPSEDLPAAAPVPSKQSTESALPSGSGASEGSRAASGNNTDTRGSSRGGSGTASTDSQPSGSAAPKWLLPSPPTETGRSQYGGRYAMPTPPTGVGRDAEYNNPSAMANPSGSPIQSSIPEVPTSRQASPPRRSDSSYYSEREFWRSESRAASYPSFDLPNGPVKPFASVRPFESGVSPYMGLFRNDTAGGTIDNYSTLVRPALDQRSMNQQFNLDTYGLERVGRLQEMTLRQMGRFRSSDRTPQGVSTPQFDRMYNGYYPVGPMQSGYGQ